MRWVHGSWEWRIGLGRRRGRWKPACWAKGWCMRADASRFAHPQPPVPRGLPKELLLILQAMARVGALSLDRR